MTFLIDTNVLLRIVQRDHKLHGVVRSTIKQLRSDGHRFNISAQNCIEFWNVVTRPLAQNGFGLTPNEANSLLKLVERLFPILPANNETYHIWRRLVLELQISGIQVHDCHIVAAMLSVGITGIVTFNEPDFNRYKSHGILVVVPK